MGVRVVGGEGNDNCRGAITLLHVYPVLVLFGECVDAVGEIEALLIAFGLRKIYTFSNCYSLFERAFALQIR